MPAPYPPPAPGAPQYAPPQGGPQYYPQPSGAPSTPPRGAPKKSHAGLIIGIILGVLVLCGLGACATVFIAAGTSGASDKKAATQAETHFSAAMTAVESADKALASAKGASNAQTAKAVSDASKQLRAARDEVASAKASAEQIKDSQGKTDYLAGLTAATATLDTLEDMVAYMDSTNGMAARATEAGALASKANGQLGQAISRANGSSYGEMGSQAAAASTNYTKAAVLFKEADKIDPTAGLKAAVVYCQKRKAQADVVVRMAAEGKASRFTAYNADIKKQAALGKEAEAAGTPAIVSDPNWGQKRIAELTLLINTSSTKADELRAKALKELGVSK